jgi:hypothetical protein
MAFGCQMAPMRVVSAICFHNHQQAAVHPTGFGVVPGAESLVGFMTAELGEDSTDGRTRSPFQIALRREIEMKIDELKTIEKRLGSPSELPADIEQAREIAHRVNNLLTTYRLGGDLSDCGANI